MCTRYVHKPRSSRHSFSILLLHHVSVPAAAGPHTQRKVLSSQQRLGPCDVPGNCASQQGCPDCLPSKRSAGTLLLLEGPVELLRVFLVEAADLLRPFAQVPPKLPVSRATLRAGELPAMQATLLWRELPTTENAQQLFHLILFYSCHGLSATFSKPRTRGDLEQKRLRRKVQRISEQEVYQTTCFLKLPGIFPRTRRNVLGLRGLLRLRTHADTRTAFFPNIRPGCTPADMRGHPFSILLAS